MPPGLNCSARATLVGRRSSQAPPRQPGPCTAPAPICGPLPPWPALARHRGASVLRPTHSHSIIRDQRDLSQLPAGWMRHPWDRAVSERSAQCQALRRKEAVVPLPSTQHIPCGPQGRRGAGNEPCPCSPGKGEGHTLQPCPQPWTPGCSSQQAS